MVSNQKPIKNTGKNVKASEEFDEKKDLEKVIANVINTCKEIITNNNTLLKDQQNVSKKVSPQQANPVQKNASEITLEKVAQDMTSVLKDLRNHLYTIKDKNDSFSDVAPKLEQSFLNSQSTSKQSTFFKNCKPTNQSKPTPPAKPQNKTNNANANVKNNTNTANTNNANANVKNNTNTANANNANANVKNNTNTANTNNANANVKNNTNTANTNAKSNPNTTTPKSNTNTANSSAKSNASSTNSKPAVINSSKMSNPSNTSNFKRIVPSSTSKMSSSSKQSRTSCLKGGNYRKVPSKSVYNPLGVIKTEVEKAIKDKKTFTIRGTYTAVRRALLKRGWVEKLHMSFRDRINEDLKKFQTYTIQELVELLRNKDIAENCRRLIKSKLLASHQVDFYWGFNDDSFKECPDKVKLTKINKFRRELFSYTSKLGLCVANKKSMWFKIPGIANLNHPRSYSLAKNGDTPEFIKDFNRTAAMALLKWVVTNSNGGQVKVLSPSGKIPVEVFDFAVSECYKFIKMAEHQDIDTEIKEAMDYEWNEFLEYFYKTVHIGNHFKTNSEITEIDMVRKANYILAKLREFYPYIEMDGVMNIWILKPTNGSQGVGIHICRTLQYILNTIKGNPNRRYIIQKYIERPLLIYNTKFDIRQWFLISSSVPLTIWMYKRCYLRFSSQTYNLRKLHESIHLTNNSVQSRYAKTNKDIALPSYNMWDSVQFKDYLSDIGYPNVFDTIIYPGMKQCITAAVIMYQEKLDRRKNCFELYGADFMLTEDFKPWLIEINSNPALHASTPVTAKMCPLVLEDVIKVVIDYEANKNADTGAFERIYQKDLSPNLPNKDLQIKGTPLSTEYFYTPSISEGKPFEMRPYEPEKKITKLPASDSIDYIKQIGKGMRKTLEDLLEILRKEKQKRHDRKHKGVATILSRIITETKESQTEYKPQSKVLSETFIKSQLLEVDEEIEETKSDKTRLVSKNNSTVSSGSKKSQRSVKIADNHSTVKPEKKISTISQKSSSLKIKRIIQRKSSDKTPEPQNNGDNNTVKTTIHKSSSKQLSNTDRKEFNSKANVHNLNSASLKQLNNAEANELSFKTTSPNINSLSSSKQLNNTEAKKFSSRTTVHNLDSLSSSKQSKNAEAKKSGLKTTVPNINSFSSSKLSDVEEKSKLKTTFLNLNSFTSSKQLNQVEAKDSTSKITICNLNSFSSLKQLKDDTEEKECGSNTEYDECDYFPSEVGESSCPGPFNGSKSTATEEETQSNSTVSQIKQSSTLKATSIGTFPRSNMTNPVVNVRRKALFGFLLKTGKKPQK